MFKMVLCDTLIIGKNNIFTPRFIPFTTKNLEAAMLKSTTVFIMLIVSMALIAGCSSGNAPMAPADANQYSDLPSNTVVNRHFLGGMDSRF